MEAGRQGEGTRFRAPFDALVLILTIVFSAILVAVAASGGIAISGHAGGALLAGVVVVGCAAILVGSYVFAPRAYRLEDRALIIERPIGPLRISLDGLQDVTVGRPRWRVGILGYRNGGLFGVYGRLYKRGQGWTCFWGRRISGIVTLGFPDRRVIVMPDDPERFAAAITHPAPLVSP
jgi:hypothetical protein